MPDRALIALVGAVLTALTLLLIAGHGPWAGDPIVTLGKGRGLNAGDVPVLLGWAIGVGACVLLWRRR